MANDAVSGAVPVSLVHGSQAPKPIAAVAASGKSVPPGKAAPAIARIAIAPPADGAATHAADPQALVVQLNKYRNDSGRPNQFRVDPASRGETIQEINPATGEVIGEFSTSQFPELARSLGIPGVLVNSRA